MSPCYRIGGTWKKISREFQCLDFAIHQAYQSLSQFSTRNPDALFAYRPYPIG
jgi:hypothetical protein